MARFSELYETFDHETGDILEWEWNDDERCFIAFSRSMEKFTLCPTQGELEREGGDEEED